MNRIKFIVGLGMMLVGLMACGETTLPGPPVGETGIQRKSGVLQGNETWRSSALYIIDGDLTVPTGVTLTVDAGTVIKFQREPNRNFDDDIRHSFIVEGNLNVNGTEDDKVYFTSTYDDTVGGDTTDDGADTVSVAGDWQNIRFVNGGVGNISYAEFRYGGVVSGDGGASSIFVIDDGELTLSNVLVRDAKYGFMTTNITDTPSLDGISFVNVPLEGILLRPVTIVEDTTLVSKEVPYVMAGDFTVASGATLSLEAGVVVKFRREPDRNFDNDVRHSLIVEGTLNVSGTENNKVYFTSTYDDTVGGDTNDDGSETAPEPTNWQSIRFQNGGGGTLDHVVIRYGGGVSGSGNDTGAIFAAGTSPTITNSVLSNNATGLVADGTGANPRITASDIADNSAFGVQARDGGAAQAQNNYWGDPSGPSGEGPGTGDQVSTNVVYQPFATSSTQ